MAVTEGGVFVPCNEKCAVVGWYRGVNVLCFIVQGESVERKVQVGEEEKMCHNVFPVSRLRGDKSAYILV